MIAASSNALKAHAAPADAVGRNLVARYGLAVERVLSDDGDSFVTLLCVDEQGERVVLKYVIATAPPDAYRRLRNEARLVQMLRAEWPLRLLRHRSSAAGHLVSEFDRGRLLTPQTIADERVVSAVALALAAFQESGAQAGDIGIEDRESPAWYYLKVLFKHLLHLWPSQLSTWDACRAAAAVVAALPAMLRRPAAAHGDLLPTNLLYHDEDGTITFTDLEAFARSYHPLFDVLAFCTSDGRNLTRWSWQAAFLRSYLEHRPRHVCPSPGSREFRRAYRGILVFFLVYRLNEARVNLAGARYFDGLGKVEYARRKFRGLFTAGGTRPPGDDTGELADRRHSLREALSRSGFRRHFRSMPLEPAQADRP